MHILLLSLVLVAWPNYADGIAPPLMITVPAAATNPEFIDRPVEVCGHVTRVDEDRNEAAMFGTDTWLIVDTRGRAELVVGTAACVTGVIRRRDGLTEQQRRARGIGRLHASHAAPSDIILYQCHDRPSCDRLMQPGPVRPEQLDVPEPAQ